MTETLPAGWGDPSTLKNAERIAQWVWCPVVWAVMCDDPCEFDKQHERDCPCGSRFPLTARPADLPSPPEDRLDLVAMGHWVEDCLDAQGHLVLRTVVRRLVDKVQAQAS